MLHYVSRLGMIVALVAMGNLLAADAADKSTPTQKQRRIIYNRDGGSYMWVKKGVYQLGPVTEDDLRAVVDEITQPGSQVDSLLLCINLQVTCYPSKVGTMVGSLVPADKRKEWDAIFQHWVANLEAFYEKGIDPNAVIITRAKERGLEVLLSYRMNDAHAGKEGSAIRCKLWVDHPKYRLGSGLDFGHEAVRDYTFRLIEEAVQRYDCDGIELDFNRWPTFFQQETEAERSKKINDLVHRVRQMLDTEGKKRGKRLVLAARVPTSYQQCRQIGLDPVIWARDGWIDFLTVSEFVHVRYDLPIAPWKKLIKEIPIYGSIESAEGPALSQCLTPEKYRRAAKHLWADGADGIYLFNFFTTREWEDKGFEPPFEVLRDLGDPKRLQKRKPTTSITAPPSYGWVGSCTANPIRYPLGVAIRSSGR